MVHFYQRLIWNKFGWKIRAIQVDHPGQFYLDMTPQKSNFLRIRIWVSQNDRETSRMIMGSLFCLFLMYLICWESASHPLPAGLQLGGSSDLGSVIFNFRKYSTIRFHNFEVCHSFWTIPHRLVSTREPAEEYFEAFWWRNGRSENLSCDVWHLRKH